jgi:hypothetical protein
MGLAEKGAHTTYIEHLRQAHTEIFLLMLVTSPAQTSLPILRERARAGVRIKLLLGDPELAAKLRGGVTKPFAQQQIDTWVSELGGNPSVEIRISDELEDLWLATSMIVDDHIVRIGVYDPDEQESRQGTLVHLESPQGLDLNLIRVCRRVFAEAWDRAIPAGRRKPSWWGWKRGWKVWTALLFTGAAFLPVPGDPLTELFIGVASGLLGTALVESKALPGRLLRRR